MGKLIALASQKGGVGKTTSAVNLAASLTLAGKKVLLVDLDPQGNASSGVGFPKTDQEEPAGFLASTLAGNSIDSFVRETKFDNLSLIVATDELSRLDLIQQLRGPGLDPFRQQLRRGAEQFDFVLLDCPPSLGGLPTVALACSDHVFVPIQCEYYAMEGLSQILPLIQNMQNSINRDLSVGGLLLTMFCQELDLSHEVVREVRDYFHASVFRTLIPRDVVLAEACSHGLPAYHYAPLSRGAWSYLELAREVLEHERS